MCKALGVLFLSQQDSINSSSYLCIEWILKLMTLICGRSNQKLVCALLEAIPSFINVQHHVSTNQGLSQVLLFKIRTNFHLGSSILWIGATGW